MAKAIITIEETDGDINVSLECDPEMTPEQMAGEKELNDAQVIAGFVLGVINEVLVEDNGGDLDASGHDVGASQDELLDQYPDAM